MKFLFISLLISTSLFFTACVTQVDVNQSKKISQEPNFIGTWVSRDENRHYIYKFELANKFTYIDKGEQMIRSSQSTWMYSKSDRTLDVTSNDIPIGGKNSVKSLTKNEFVLSTDKGLYRALKQVEKEYERLTFIQNDFTQQDKTMLPYKWSLYGLAEFMSSIKSLDYKIIREVEDVNLVSEVRVIPKVNMKKMSVALETFILEDAINEQISREIKDKRYENRYNDFFPQEELSFYKNVAIEEVSVPAGRFECMVVEGMAFEMKYKYWMIKEMPGVYARVVLDGNGRFEVKELQRINKINF